MRVDKESDTTCGSTKHWLSREAIGDLNSSDRDTRLL